MSTLANVYCPITVPFRLTNNMATDTIQSGKITPILNTMSNGYDAGRKTPQPQKPVKKNSISMQNGTQSSVKKSDSIGKPNAKQRRGRARYISVPTSPPAQAKHSVQSLNVGKYSIVRTLGRGNFAQVKLAVHLTTGREVAIKMIDKTTLNESCRVKLAREVRVLKTLSHPNIVQLYEVIETTRHVYLVMEYAKNGEVFEHLLRIGRMPEKEAQKLFRQLFSAVEYCHQKNIVHRDLKAENLLLDENNNLKLADFGFANVFDSECHLDTFCGSPPYAAPELLSGQKYHGPEVDVWALGVILYMLICGRLPFEAYTLKELHSRVMNGKYRIPFYMSEHCEAMLKKMLVLNPKKRATIRDLLKEPWINMGYENDILQPFKEPPLDYGDPVRRAIMNELGFNPEDLKDAFENKRFNNVTATYLLLEDKETRHKLTNRLRNKCDKERRNSQNESDTVKSQERQFDSSDEDEDMTAMNVDGHERSSSAVVRSEQQEYTLHSLARNGWATGSLHIRDPVKKMKDFMQQPKQICDPSLNLPKLIANSDKNGDATTKLEPLTIDSLIERTPQERHSKSNEKMSGDDRSHTGLKTNGLLRIPTSSLEQEDPVVDDSSWILPKKRNNLATGNKIKTDPLSRKTFQPGDVRPRTRTHRSRSIIIVSDTQNGREHDVFESSKSPVRIISLIYPDASEPTERLSRSVEERFHQVEHDKPASSSKISLAPSSGKTYTSVLHRDVANGTNRSKMMDHGQDNHQETVQRPSTTNATTVPEQQAPNDLVTVNETFKTTITPSAKPRLLSPPVMVSRTQYATGQAGQSKELNTNVDLKMSISNPWAESDKQERLPRRWRRYVNDTPISGVTSQTPERTITSPARQNSTQMWGMPRFADNRTNIRMRLTKSPPLTLKRTVLNEDHLPDVQVIQKGNRVCVSTPASPVFRTIEQPTRIYSIEPAGHKEQGTRDGWSSLAQRNGPSGQYTTRQMNPRRTPSARETPTYQARSVVYPSEVENGHPERRTPLTNGDVRPQTPYRRDASPRAPSRRDSSYTRKSPSSVRKLSSTEMDDKYPYTSPMTTGMRIPIIPKYDQVTADYSSGNSRMTMVNAEPSSEERNPSWRLNRTPSRNGETTTVPRRLNWAFGINIQGKNAQNLMRALLRMLEQKQIDYIYQNPYRLQCSCPSYNERGRASPKTFQSGEPIKWEMEIVQLPRSKYYGVRFKYLSGDQAQYRALEKSITSQVMGTVD